ncbi:uncharacterized protein LOC127265053 [Andrographis paniculata]|uniref:uncharacterized protein LOC127265053 n=1 Tax=Andrographis paniculata TaxID=175694 RepID=UPI0021E968FC|nr:uncharacterized protein LOC127265053 [Andrographis paniculata]
MERHTTTSRAEAERLLGIAEKLLRSKDYAGCRDFAILAQETEPLLEGSDQILAVAEVLLAAEGKRLRQNHHDWYAILQIPQRTDEVELIKKQYRRLALLLHPDKNKFPFADSAFRLVADAWSVLSDSAKKSSFDSEFANRFTKVDLGSKKHHQQQPRPQKKQPAQRGDSSSQKLPVRRSGRSSGGPATTPSAAGVDANVRNSGGGNPGWLGNFWTTCPYCYNLYEFPRAYEGCCLRCDNQACRRAFTAAEVRSIPPQVPGKDAYYCCWGFFPMGFTAGNAEAAAKKIPKWMPSNFGGGAATATATAATPVSAAPPPPPPVNMTSGGTQSYVAASNPSGTKKRGRPRKYF